MTTSGKVSATLVSLGLLVGGCVTLLPASPPAQLYRFGFEVRRASTAVAATVPGLHLALVATSLPVAAAGAGILTSRGDSVAYIARARWAAPATVLVDEAAVQAFSGTNVGLTRSIAGAVASLALDVRTFETRYGEASTPSVRIVIHAALTRPDGDPVAERTFASEQRTDADRVSAIVAAYDLALSDDLSALAAWSAAVLPAIASAKPASGSARP